MAFLKDRFDRVERRLDEMNGKVRQHEAVLQRINGMWLVLLLLWAILTSWVTWLRKWLLGTNV